MDVEGEGKMRSKSKGRREEEEEEEGGGRRRGGKRKEGAPKNYTK